MRNSNIYWRKKDNNARHTSTVGVTTLAKNNNEENQGRNYYVNIEQNMYNKK